MHPLLSKLLQKRGISSVIELTQDEKDKFDQWNGILIKENLTTQDIAQFCETQIAAIEKRWLNENLSQEAISKLVQQHIVYKQFLIILRSPKEERETLEKYLEQLVKDA